MVLDGKSFDLPSMLLRKEAYVAVPVTAPTAAGLLLIVFTLKPLGPQTSTSTMCQSVILWRSLEYKHLLINKVIIQFHSQSFNIDLNWICGS